MRTLGNSHQPKFSRRAAVAGLLAPMLGTPKVGAQPELPDYVIPFDLGHGLEIRDYRLLPTEDVMRFIVELHNNTDEALDTPSVGLIVEGAPAENFGWASPASPVLHSHSSNILVGIAPISARNLSAWDDAEWTLCAPISTEKTDELEEWELEISSELNTVDSTTAKAMVKVTNHSDQPTRGLTIQGTIRDRFQRICGATATGRVSELTSGETRETGFTVNPDYPGILSPFNFIDSVDSIEVSFTVQPVSFAVNEGCSPVMPWNRDD